MAAVSVSPSDLTPFLPTIPVDKAAAMIEDAMAMAARVAPCIMSAEFAYEQAARAIIRGAIIRWAEAGSGALQQETVGGVSQTLDTRQVRRGMFWPSEIQDLLALCSDGSMTGRAFELDTAPVGSGVPAVSDEFPWYPSSGWSGPWYPSSGWSVP